MAKNDSTSSGGDCGPVPGLAEFLAAGGGARRPHQPRRGDQVAGIATNSDRDSSRGALDDHQAAARAALALHNSGASDSDGAGPVSDPGGLLSGGGGRPSGSTSSDPSSLEAQR
jgi:hypothetical protein